MSRAYRITVKESQSLQLRGSDEISTTLEVLEILPCEQTAELLQQELKARGFEEQSDGTVSRTTGKVSVVVDPRTNEVVVKAVVEESVDVSSSREIQGYDDVGPNVEELRREAQDRLKEELTKKADTETERLTNAAGQHLEKKLAELQPELSEVVNKVTREALKIKAKQLGTVKEVHEDEATGSLSMTIEV